MPYLISLTLSLGNYCTLASFILTWAILNLAEEAKTGALQNEDIAVEGKSNLVSAYL